MTYDGNRLMPIEWTGWGLWIVFWGVLAYIAISEKSITLGTKLHIDHFQGSGAMFVGFVLVGVALVGVDGLLRLNPRRQLLRVFLILAWLASAIVYISLFYD